MKIAIDPGHGMSNRRQGVFDPGAMCRVDGVSYQEADIVLSYGKKLRGLLEDMGHEVFMTRSDNEEDAPLIKRARRAEQAGCEAIISLHTNAHRNPSANGMEIYYKGRGSRGFAKSLLDELIRITGLKDRGIRKLRGSGDKVKFDGVLLLVELGFLTNANDRKLLLDSIRETEVCEAICRVVKTKVPPSGNAV